MTTSADTAAIEMTALPKDVLDALRFYAHGHHYNIDDDHQQFDTVSGEPVNWIFSEKEDDCTMFEDGGIARAVLAGRSAGFEEPVEPFEGEVFTALSTAPTTGSAPEPLVFDDWFDTVYMPTRLESDRVAERHAAIAGWIAAHEYWAAPPANAPVASVPFLGESDMSALVTFHSQTEDHEADGYTVHKETMKRLAELGVVNSRGFGRYETTAFGAWVVETALEQHPTLPLRTVAEHNERSALLAASMGGDRT